MNAKPLIEPANRGPMSPQERQRAALSALMDEEMDHGDLDVLLEADMAQLTEFGQTCELIGDALRGTSTNARVSGPAFSAAVMACLRDESRAIPQVKVLRVGADRAAPANDALFRWKLVAGLASLTAVFAVSWSVIGGALDAPAAGPQLAAASVPAASAEPDAPAVLVQTTQGQVLRDPRLEQLLAEHRQFGGMSALQAPAGFLRNATYDSSPQR